MALFNYLYLTNIKEACTHQYVQAYCLKYGYSSNSTHYVVLLRHLITYVASDCWYFDIRITFSAIKAKRERFTYCNRRVPA